ncbi:hypothetical protein DIPPA_29550 [Diplonema papillatum]|nr:hypothetical protein DIPPA_29731 [Diplonema papillatum]KAJ9473550.1 hypothetical protein DIPPA_29550 [Diplonema papillatum]
MSWKEWGAGQPDYCLLLESLENSKRVPPWMDGGARRREDDEELFPKLARWQLWGYDQGQGQFAGEPSSPRETKPRPRSAGNSETCRRTPTSPWCWSRSLHHDDTLRVWPSSEVSTALASIATCAASHDFRKLAWAGWGQKSSAIKQLPSEVWQHIVQYLWPRNLFAPRLAIKAFAQVSDSVVRTCETCTTPMTWVEAVMCDQCHRLLCKGCAVFGRYGRTHPTDGSTSRVCPYKIGAATTDSRCFNKENRVCYSMWVMHPKGSRVLGSPTLVRSPLFHLAPQ